jgi:putative transposase
VDVSPKPALVSTSKLQCGTQVTWDSRLWSVLNLGDTSVSLLSEDQKLTEIPVTVFETLVREDRLKAISDTGGSDSAIRDRLSRASEADLKVATHRSGLIGQYLDRGILPTSSEVPRRTFFRWLCQFRKAEAASGNGFLGLLPHLNERGNHAAKLPETSRRLMCEHIERDYETLKQKTRYASWIQLQLVCDAQETATPKLQDFLPRSAAATYLRSNPEAARPAGQLSG